MRNGWIETTLGQVADVIDPHPSHRAPIVDELGIPFIGIGDLRNTGDVDFSKARKVSREILSEHKLRYSRSDYLIGLGRVASIGMVVKLPDDSIDYVVSPTLAVIKAKKILPQFLYISLQGNHLQEQFQKYKKGSTRESVGMQVLRKLSIQVPPLAEQKRIVDLISSVDSYIEALEQQAESARKSRSAVLHEMLSAGGDGWTETTLEEVVAFSIGGVWGDEIGQSEIDVAVYRQTEFTDSGELKTPADALRSIKRSQLQSRALNYGDILIQKSAGTPTLPGRVVMVRNIPEDEAVFSNFLNLIRADATKCLPHYLFILFWFKHKNGIAFEYQRGTNIRNLDLQNYLHESIILPPLPEQKRIVDLISSMDDGISATERLIRNAKQLRSGLLSDLISGAHEIPEGYDKVMGAA